jgi:HK97 family phage portal protein
MAKKAARKPVRRAKVEHDRQYVGASVSYTEASPRYSTRSTDFDLMARAVSGVAFSAANLNATACASQTLRLYRPAGGQIIGRSRRVSEKSRIAWVRGDRDVRPGVKAVSMAGAADDVEEVTDHPVLDLLNSPEPYMTATQWRWLAFFHSEIAGRSYFYIGERSRFGVASMYLLAPQYVYVRGSRTRMIEEYRYGVDNADAVVFKPEDVIYHRERVHPFYPLHAVSWLHAVKSHTDLEAAAIASEIARWSNGGTPGMAITVKDPSGKTTPSQVEQMEAAFDRKYRGVNKVGSTMFLLNGEISQYAAKPHEMQYVEGYRRMEESVYRAAGIPEPVWRMAEANRASALAADPQWMGITILPKLNAIADTFTERLLPEFDGTDGWWFAYDNPVREDQAAIVSRSVSMAGAGLITGNEARAAQGIGPGGEELDVLRYGGVPLVDVGRQQVFQSAPVEDVGPEVSDGGEEEPDDAEQEQEAEVVGEKSRRTVKAARETSQEIVARAFEDSLTRWYQRVLRDAVTDTGSVDITRHAAALEAVVENNLRSLFIAGTVDAMRDVGAGGSFNMATPRATQYLEARGGELIVSVNETLANAIGNRLSQLQDAGASVEEMRSAVANMGVADWSAERIVRTEMNFAYTEGSRQAWESVGVESKDFGLAGGPCPLCEAVYAEKGGKPHPIAEPYYKGGESVVALDGRVHTFAGDAQGPPWHPNCRCFLLPVTGGGQ